MPMEQVTRENAKEAFLKGWQLIPLKKDAKEPNLPIGHKFLSEKASTDEYRAFDFHNYGIVCGALSGICVLDIDGDDGEHNLLANEIYTSDYITPRVYTPNGMHMYFKYHPAVKTRVALLGKGVDIRSNGSYVVGAGSRINQQYYTWSEDFGPDTELADPPQFMLESPESKAGISEGWYIGETIADGQRNNTLTSVGGTLVVRGISHETVKKILLTINDDMCNPPLDEKEVLGIAVSVERYRNGG